MVYHNSNGLNARSDFVFSGQLPEDTISYSRKGGCFVSICRGIAIAILILIFIFFLTFTVFFATKYAYDIKPNITLEEFLNHRPYIIDKRDRTVKHIIPKAYCLYISPIFNQTKKPFSYNGIVYITVVSKKPNTRRIEVNVKELEIDSNKVSVYRSLELTSLDFDDDPEWDLKESKGSQSKSSQSRRNRRDVDEDQVDDEDEDNDEMVEEENNDEEDEEVANEPQDEPVVDELSAKLTDEMEGKSVETNASSEIDETDHLNLVSSTSMPIETTTDENKSTATSTKRPRANKFRLPQLQNKEEYVPITIEETEMDAPNERLFIYLDTEMKKDAYYIVKIEFSGNMTHDRGLYFTTYEDTHNELSYFTATFLEPDARLLFPCLEDYNVQTPYDISVARHMSMTTESISDLEEAETLNSTWFVDEYNRTNLVRASEIGFIVTNMQPKSFKITENITFIFYAREKYQPDLNYTVDILNRVIKIYENYFDMPFPYEKVKYVCVPNGSPGQREVKDSMILSSEHHILYSHYFPSTAIDYVDESIAYEIALEWIHRTYEWENVEQYWVYETLPLFLENVALDQFSPKEGQSDHLIIGDRFKALRDEMYHKSTALQVFDNDWDDTEYYHFIQRKGFSILRMYNHSIGQETFQRAVKKFVSARLNRERSFFIECIDQMAKEVDTDPLEIKIMEFVESWAAMEKYPILNVTKNYTSGDIRVDHVQFSFGDEAPHQPVSIPIWYTTRTTRIFNDRPQNWIVAPHNSTVIKKVFEPLATVSASVESSDGEATNTTESADTEQEEIEEPPVNWVIFNPMGLGYYRVNYDVETWKEFARILKEEPEEFPYYTRALLIDDALNLARLGFLNYSIAFDLVSYLSVNETNYWPWKEAFNNLKFLYNILRDRPGFEVVEKFMIEKIKPVYVELIQNDGSAEAANQNEEKLRLKSLVYEWACLVGHSACIEHQRKEFYKLIEQDIIIDSQKSLDEDELFLMVCTTIRYSGRHEWNILAKYVEKTIDLNEKKTLLRGMGCTKEIHLIRNYLKYLTDDDLYKLVNEVLTSISSNKVGLKYTLDYLYDHWNEVRQFHDLKELSVLFKKIVNRHEFEIFRGIFAKYSETFTTRDKEILRATRAMIMKSLDWKDQVSKRIIY